MAFESLAGDLVPEDTSRSHEFQEIFVRDMRKWVTERVNVSSLEEQANKGVEAGDDFGRHGDEDSYTPVISANGRYVAFASGASNLVTRDGNGQADVFVRDLERGKTERVSVGSNGQEAEYPSGTLTYDEGSFSPSISADGSTVAFSSTAANLVPGDTNFLADVFVRDLSTGETTRVSVSSEGEQTERIEIQELPYGGSSSVSISGDETVVMFTTMAPNLVEGDTNKLPDTFVHDLKTQKTERVSVSSSGRQATGCTDDECLGEEGSAGGSISFDGHLVAFTSGGNLAPGDRDHPYGTNHDVFIHNRTTHETILATYPHEGRPSRKVRVTDYSLYAAETTNIVV